MLYPNTAYNRILCTDLDGTFIGDDTSMYELLKLIEDKGIMLVFSTGRHLPSLQSFIREKEIRNPDACILMVGTEIYVYQNGTFVKDENWSEVISEGWDKDKIAAMLDDIEEITLQDQQWQTEFKASYYLRENADTVLNTIERRMQNEGLKAHIVYSGEQFLDFLPEHSGKAEALKYVAGHSGIREDNIVVCGDSGNDTDMFKAGFKGIIVGNALSELQDFPGENAYHAVKSYSAGIIEGLGYYGFV